MAFVRFAEGLALMAIAFGPIGAAVCMWRARLVPSWSGAPARLVEMILGIAAVLAVCELLGTLFLFRIAVVVPVMAITGTLAWLIGRRGLQQGASDRSSDLFNEPAVALPPPAVPLATTVVIGVLAADWASRTVDAYHHGITTIDSLWYHMPFAARFVQDAAITPLHYADGEAATVFFPSNSELVHALGIMFMGNDVLSPALNLAWLALALLAGWCIGRPSGVAHVTLAGVAALMATPGLVATQPGGAYDDVVGLALVLASVALIIMAPSSRPDSSGLALIVIAGLAAGLALGTKFTFIGPVGALTIGMWLVARRGHRAVQGSLWLLAVLLTGSFWYLRNFALVGNPLPSLNIKIGPLKLPSPSVGTPSSTVAHFLLNGRAWRGYFLPGLRSSIGPVWWALLALAGVGLVWGAMAGHKRIIQMLSLVGLVSIAIYLVTPQYLAILGAPIFFVDNVRYADAGVVMGLVILPLMLATRSGQWSWYLWGCYAAVLAATQLDGTIWPIDWLPQHFAVPIGGIDSLIGVLAGLSVICLGLAHTFWTRGNHHWQHPSLMVVLVAVAVVASGFGLQQFYLRNRYAPSTAGLPFGWARQLHNAHIGVAGAFTQLQYALYGNDLSNYVQYVAQAGPHRGYAPIRTCTQWRSALNLGHFQYVVTSTGLVSERQKVFTTPYSYTVWTAEDPAAVLVRRNIWVVTAPGSTAYVGFSEFRLHGPMDLGGCSAPNLRKTVPTQS